MLKRLFLATALILSTAAAHAFETRATAAWVYDVTSGIVLMDKNADQPLPPASMSKLMTLNMLFEALRDGRVTMDTTFPVSARAHAMGGSTMFLSELDTPTVAELIQGIIINSGNDACVVVAEGLSGSEDSFAAAMTERGRALGMTASVFKNASGWPAPSRPRSACRPRHSGSIAAGLASRPARRSKGACSASQRRRLCCIAAWVSSGLITGVKS